MRSGRELRWAVKVIGWEGVSGLRPQVVEEFRAPSWSKTYAMKRGDYSKLDNDGLINPGEHARYNVGGHVGRRYTSSW